MKPYLSFSAVRKRIEKKNSLEGLTQHPTINSRSEHNDNNVDIDSTLTDEDECVAENNTEEDVSFYQRLHEPTKTYGGLPHTTMFGLDFDVGSNTPDLNQLVDPDHPIESTYLISRIPYNPFTITQFKNTLAGFKRGWLFLKIQDIIEQEQKNKKIDEKIHIVNDSDSSNSSSTIIEEGDNNNNFKFKQLKRYDKTLIKRYLGKWSVEALYGLLVTFILIPETISFATMAEVDAAIGLRCKYFYLYVHIALFSFLASWMLSFPNVIFAGRSLIVQGLSASIANLFSKLIESEYAPVTAITVGLILILVSFLRVSFLVRFLSKSTMIGTFNGIAIVIALAQLHNFQDEHHEYIEGWQAAHSAILCIICMAVFILWGKVPYIGQFTSVILTFGVGFLYDYTLKTFGEVSIYEIGQIKHITQGLEIPKPFFIDPHYKDVVYTSENITNIVFGAFRLSLVMLLETLITCKILDDGTEENDNDANQTIFAVGVGNVISGFFGGMPGGLMIPMCTMLLRGGSLGKESSFFTALWTMIGSFSLLPVIQKIPAPSLAAIMLVVVSHTFCFDSIFMIVLTFLPEKLRSKHSKLQRKIPKMDAIIILLTTLMTPLVSIDVSILTGIFLSLISFANQSVHDVQVVRHIIDVDNQRIEEMKKLQSWNPSDAYAINIESNLHQKNNSQQTSGILINENHLHQTAASSKRGMSVAHIDSNRGLLEHMASAEENSNINIFNNKANYSSSIDNIFNNAENNNDDLDIINNNSNRPKSFNVPRTANSRTQVGLPTEMVMLMHEKVKEREEKKFSAPMSFDIETKKRLYGVVYDILGPFYFSSALAIRAQFHIDEDPDIVFIRLEHTSIMDYTALETISFILSLYRKRNKTVHVLRINQACQEKFRLAQAMLTPEKEQFEMENHYNGIMHFDDEMHAIAPMYINLHHQNKEVPEEDNPTATHRSTRSHTNNYL